MNETAPDTAEPHLGRRGPASAFTGGAVIGMLGGLIGLGGAEFRLPLLIGYFRFVALEAVVLNKATSLVVVAFALPFRATAVPLDDVLVRWDVVANLLAGSLVGAWLGASWAVRLRSDTLHRILAVLLVCIALVLLFGHGLDGGWRPPVEGWPQVLVGIAAGFGIGIVASLMGVAGGELLIPTLVLLYGLDPRLAGSLSLAISLPTMIVGFARYSRDGSFLVLGRHRLFVATLALGSLAGAFAGALLLAVVPVEALLPLLALILVASALKLWKLR